MMDAAPGIVEFIGGSTTRVAVLAALADGGSRAAIQRATGLPSEAVGRLLAEFEDRALIARVGDRYEPTPVGADLATRFASMLDAIEATQRLVGLLDALSAADPDPAVLTLDRVEIVAPTSADPSAPGRRFADRLQAASSVRLLAPTAGAVLVGDAPDRGDRPRTIEVVLPSEAIGRERRRTAHRYRAASAADPVTVFAFDGPIEYVVGTIDGFAVVGVPDDAGGVLGYAETTDAGARSWTEAHVAAYRQRADRLSR